MPAAAGVRMRATYRDIELYAPDRRPAAIDLSDNTNRWGVPPAALRALRDTAESSAARYPDLYSAQLKRAIAQYAGVDPSMVVTGCGSDDILDSAVRAFAEPGEGVAMAEPSFPMVPLFARMNGLSVHSTQLTAAFDIAVDDLLSTDAAVVYVCSPNNPTGTVVPAATIDRIIARARGIVIVDEAYVEFAAASVVDLVKDAPRLLVVRTMSKAFGLAGLRIGYAIGAPSLVAEVEKSRGPYKVSAVAERAGVAALTEDLDWVRARIADAVAARSVLSAAFASRGLHPLPSASNFVLVPVRNAESIALRMRGLGVAVRAFSALGGHPAVRGTGGGALRITVAPAAEMDAALAAFDEARSACE